MQRGAALIAILSLASLAGRADNLHTPEAGTPERKAIMDALHREYTTGSGPKVKFLVKYLKVHSGWAWVNVVPLDPSGKPEGDEWPSLLRRAGEAWRIIDLIAVASDIDDPVGPADPGPKFIRALQKKFPGLPTDIIPNSR